MITEAQKQLLKHILGADERYKKKQWGFRNHFCSIGKGEDHNMLLEMEKEGFVCRNINNYGTYKLFKATKKGALAIGFKPYQLRKIK